MPGARYRKVHVPCPPLAIHDESDSGKYTKLLATQIKGFVLSTAKAAACESSLQQVLCAWNLCAEHTTRRGQAIGWGNFI